MELGVLGVARESARRGHGTLVVLTGEAGVGKSRLLREVASDARTSGFLVVSGRATSAVGGPPFAGLTEALLHARRARPEPDLAELGSWAMPLVDVLPLEAGQHQGPSGFELSSVVHAEAILRLLALLSASGPILMGLEDLQWADPDTVAVLEFLGEGLQHMPVLCVATVRSDEPSPVFEVVRPMGARGTAIVVELARLSDSETVDMARACRPGLGEQQLRRVTERADGVPLLIEELLS